MLCRVCRLQHTRAIAWAPAGTGPSYTFATAADMDVYLWGVNPFSALVIQPQTWHVLIMPASAALQQAALAVQAQGAVQCSTVQAAALADTTMLMPAAAALWINTHPALQIHCDKVTSGSVRRTINCLCFNADGAWLFAGTASGDVLTINVGRKAVQVRSIRCKPFVQCGGA